MPSARRLPPPWTLDEQNNACFIVRDTTGQTLSCFLTRVAIEGPVTTINHLLNNPMIAALANVLKCKLKPTTAADVSAFTSSLSAFTANTVNR